MKMKTLLTALVTTLATFSSLSSYAAQNKSGLLQRSIRPPADVFVDVITYPDHLQLTVRGKLTAVSTDRLTCEIILQLPDEMEDAGKLITKSGPCYSVRAVNHE